jgi:hypothetical protein
LLRSFCSWARRHTTSSGGRPLLVDFECERSRGTLPGYLNPWRS